MDEILKDLPYKEGFFNNAYMAFGQFKVAGHTMDYLFNLMSYNVLSDRTGWASYFVLLDETKNEQVEYGETYTKDSGTIMASTERLAIRTTDFEISLREDGLHLLFEVEDFTLQLILNPRYKAQFVNDTGELDIGSMSVFDFSYPYCETTGSYFIGGHLLEIHGDSWFHRKWQNNLPQVSTLPLFGRKHLIRSTEKKLNAKASYQTFWGVISAKLDAEYALNFWFAYDNGQEYDWAVITMQAGFERKVEMEPVGNEILDYMEAEHEDHDLKLTTHVNAPDLDLHFLLSFRPKRHRSIFEEMDNLYFFEGLTRIKGTWNGVPLAGYTYIGISDSV
ncbi:MAG: hypothetical protein MR799_06460 [Lachnospiraceae bacterium]|nr:hypothetical protein [Lachnospiraceae bacterium]